MHFGEISLMTGNKRSATIKTRNYSTLGKMEKNAFHEMCMMNTDLKKALFKSM
jgi:CRP-like cAMP-binding protein